jgi:hypothetical protein
VGGTVGDTGCEVAKGANVGCGVRSEVVGAVVPVGTIAGVGDTVGIPNVPVVVAGETDCS